MPDEVYKLAEESMPVAKPAPPAGRKFPCPSCGARLDFDPNARGLQCPYCNYHEEIDNDHAGSVEEKDYFAYVDKIKSGGIQTIANHNKEVKCTGCGATVLLEDKIQTDQCPFCHTQLEDEPHVVEGLIEPESVLPFAVDLRGARDKFTRWLEGLWFAPSELTKIANLGQLTGVYVPFWTYDSMTYTRYSGERGDNYTDYETVTVRDSNGNTSTQTRPVTRIAWSSVSGEVQHFFDDVLVCGSTSVPRPMMDSLAPWDLPELTPFNSSYLSGFKTERYAVGLQDGMKEAKDWMAPVISQLIRRDIGGDHQRISDQRTKYTAVTFKHTLLPVWIAVYRYHDAVYQILVNGRTGKVAGKRPYSTWKIVRLVLLILLAIALLAVVVRSTSKKSPRRADVSHPVAAVWESAVSPARTRSLSTMPNRSSSARHTWRGCSSPLAG